MKCLLKASVIPHPLMNMVHFLYKDINLKANY